MRVARRWLLSAVVVLCAVAATVPAVGAPRDTGGRDARSLRLQHFGGPGRASEHGFTPGAQPTGKEVLARRTATSRTWKTGDGRFHTRVFATPVNYRDAAGHFRPIDESLVADPDAGYALENRADRYQVSFPDSLSAKPIEVSRGGDRVSFRLVGAHGRPTAAGARARFEDALPGVTATYTAQPERVKEDLTLASASAPAAYDYAVGLSRGLSMREDGQGGIDVVDRKGAVQFSFEAPYAYDHAGARIDSGRQLSLRLVRHGRVRLAIDRAWLASADREFPVVIDPGVDVSENEECYIQGGSGASTSFCGGANLKVGWDGTQAYRALLRFDVAGGVPANSMIAGAHLVAYLNGKTSSNTTGVAAQQVTRSWTTGATWNKFDGTNAWTAAGGDFQTTPEYVNPSASGTTGQTYAWGVTGLTQKWLDGATPNYGVLLKEPTENVNNVLSFTSATPPTANAPYLQVDWEPKFMGDQPWYPMAAKTQLTDRQSLEVNAAGGDLLVHSTDLQIAGVGLPFTVERTLNNISPDMDSWGYSWSINSGFDMWLDQHSDGQTFYDVTGTPFYFKENSDGSYTSPPGIDATLKTNADATNTVTYNKSGTEYNFDDDGDKLNTVKDKNGRTITINYGANFHPSTVVDSEGRTTTFTYESGSWSPRISQITDSTGRSVSYTYWPNSGPLKTFTDGAGKTTSYGYNSDGSLTSVTDPNGNITQIGYDTSYRVTSIKRVTNNTTMAGDTTTFTYNSGNTVVTDPNGHTTTYAFDSTGRTTGVTDGLGHQHSQSWNADNQPINYTSPVNQSTGKFDHNDYDSKNNQTGNTGPGNGSTTGPATTWSYNLSGAHPFFPDSGTNPQGQTLNFTPDSSTSASPNLQSVGVSGQTGLLANYSYDSTVKGQINTSTDANGHVTTYGYETLAPYTGKGGDLKTITPPLPQGATTLGHDGLSRVTTVKDGLLQTTTYTYDGDDRVTRIDYPDTTYVTYTYDGNGNITQVYDSNGAQTENYVYDRKNRLTSDSGATGSDTYTYDAADNLKTVADAGGTVTYAYDAGDNECWAYVGSSSNTCASAPAGATSFSYDNNGNRTHTNYPGSVDMAATWDNDDRIKEIKATKTGVATPLTDFTYDYLESTTDRDRRASVLDASNNKTFYSYNGKGFLKQAQTKNAGGTGSVVTDLGYSYDDDGNLCWTYPGAPPTGTGIDCGHPPASTTRTFHYDNANELCWSVAGASTTTTCSPAPTGATTYSVDADGQETAQSGRGTITWNKRHQATNRFSTSMGYFGADNSVRLTDGTSSFKYNVLGLGTKTVSGVNAYYTRDSNGQLLSDRTSAGTYNYLFDGLGSVVALTDSTGAVAKRYSYDPYGAVTAGAGSVDNPWQYASGFYDSGPNTVKFGQRYYDPSIARWTQTDPIDAVGIQQGNRYLYVGNDPLNAVDPSGASAAGAAALGLGAVSAGLGCPTVATGVGAAACLTGVASVSFGLLDVLSSAAEASTPPPRKISGPDHSPSYYRHHRTCRSCA